MAFAEYEENLPTMIVLQLGHFDVILLCKHLVMAFAEHKENLPTVIILQLCDG